MDPELSDADMEAINKLIDEVEKSNKQWKMMEESRRIEAANKAASMDEKFDRIIGVLEQMVQRSQPEPLFEDQITQPEKSSQVSIPEVAACGLDDPSDVKVDRSNDDDQVSSDLLLSSDSVLIEVARKTKQTPYLILELQKEVISEYFTINYSSAWLDDEVVMELDETHVLKLTFSFSKLNLILCSPSVCENASTDWSSYFVTNSVCIKSWCSPPPLEHTPIDYKSVLVLKVDEIVLKRKEFKTRIFVSMSSNFCTELVRQNACETLPFLLPPAKPPDECLSLLQPWKGIKGVQRRRYVKFIDGNYVYDKEKSDMYDNEWYGAAVEEKLMSSSFTGDTETYILKGSFSIQEWTEEYIALMIEIIVELDDVGMESCLKGAESGICYLLSPLEWPLMEEIDPNSPCIIIGRVADDKPFVEFAFKFMCEVLVGSLIFVRGFARKLTTWPYATHSIKRNKGRVGRPLKIHLNSREALQLLPGLRSYVGEVVIDTDRSKMLVKIHPEVKYVVDTIKGIIIIMSTPTSRVTFQNDNYTLHFILPGKVNLLGNLILHTCYATGSKKVAQWVTKPPPMPPDIIFVYTLLIEGKVIMPIHIKVLAPLVEDLVSVTHHLDHAHFIITNTYQDVAQVDDSHRGVTLTWPYRGIHGIDALHTVFNIVSLGVDMTIYFSYNDDYKRLTTRHESIEVVVYSSVSYARLDWVKNLKIWMFETTLLNLDFSLDDHAFLVRYINKFFLFSLPRPPEIATLRTRLILRGEECYVLNII